MHYILLEKLQINYSYILLNMLLLYRKMAAMQLYALSVEKSSPKLMPL